MRKKSQILNLSLLGKMITVMLWLMLQLIIGIGCKEEKEEGFVVTNGEDSHLYTPQIAALERFNERITRQSWSVISVSKSDLDVTEEYSEFSILFTGSVGYRTSRIYGNFTAQHGGSLFPDEGLWDSFASTSTIYIEERETACEFSEEYTRLQLTFTVPISEESSHKEDYVFLLKKAD